HALLVSCADAAPTEIYTLSLHDALPISAVIRSGLDRLMANASGVALPLVQFHEDDNGPGPHVAPVLAVDAARDALRTLLQLRQRSEEHTSELQSRENLVCRLLLEKKKNY